MTPRRHRGPRPQKLDTAIAYLGLTLSMVGSAPQRELAEGAALLGVGLRTLAEAKARLDVVAEVRDGRWVWTIEPATLGGACRQRAPADTQVARLQRLALGALARLAR